MEKQKNYLKKSFAVLSACSCLVTGYNSSIYAGGPSISKAEKIFKQPAGGFKKVREYLNREFSNMTFEKVYKEVLKENVKKSAPAIRDCYFIALCDKLLNSKPLYDFKTLEELENTLEKKYGVINIEKIPIEMLVFELSSSLVNGAPVTGGIGYDGFFSSFLSDTLNKLNISNFQLCIAGENSKPDTRVYWLNTFIINDSFQTIDLANDVIKNRQLNVYNTFSMGDLLIDIIRNCNLNRVKEITLYKNNTDKLELFNICKQKINDLFGSIENADAKILEYLNK